MSRTGKKKPPPGTPRSAPHSGPAFAPAEALDILLSAISYCQQAGFTVRAGNTSAGLTLIIPGARVDHNGERSNFRPANFKEKNPDARSAEVGVSSDV